MRVLSFFTIPKTALQTKRENILLGARKVAIRNMGRITIFSLEDCRHCQRTKNALKEKQLPFVDISLTTYPSRRNDMLSLTDRLTVPQCFVNEKHIGGATEMLEWLQEFDESNDDNDTTPLERYGKEIAPQPDPTDPRLREINDNDDEPIKIKEALPRDENDDILLPTSNTKISVLNLMEKLKTILSCTTKKDHCRMTLHKHSFSGIDFVHALEKELNLSDNNIAIAFGTTLLEKRIIQCIRPFLQDSTQQPQVIFEHSSKAWYRLQCYHTPHILNSYRVWTCTTSVNNSANDIMALLQRLKKQLSKIESDVTDGQGYVDYQKATSHCDFSTFEEAVCELQVVDWNKLLDQSNYMLVSGSFCCWKIGFD